MAAPRLATGKGEGVTRSIYLNPRDDLWIARMAKKYRDSRSGVVARMIDALRVAGHPEWTPNDK